MCSILFSLVFSVLLILNLYAAAIGVIIDERVSIIAVEKLVSIFFENKLVTRCGASLMTVVVKIHDDTAF